MEKAIWLFAGAPMQEEAAKKVKDGAYKLILTDMNPACVCAKYADEFVEKDTFDIAGNIEVAKKLKDKYEIVAVFTVGADCHETVACVAKSLGLPGIDPEISKICRYKYLSREVLAKAGVPQPKFRRAKTFEEAKIVLGEVGFPAVVKSANNSGSRGFCKLDKMEDLTLEVFQNAFDNGTAGYVLLEELLIPVENAIAEFSIETLWHKGKMTWLNAVDRLFRKDFLLFDCLKDLPLYKDVSWAIELGHVNPAVHSAEMRGVLENLLFKIGAALGIDKEKHALIVKYDIILTPKGPYILEVTPRLSGGWDSSKSTIMRGADFIGGAMHLAMGEEVNEDFLAKYFKYKNPELFAAVLTVIPDNAKDCVGRKYAIGCAANRDEALIAAYNNLLLNKYL